MACGSQCQNNTKGYRIVNDECQDVPIKRPLLDTLGIKVQPLSPPGVLKRITEACNKYQNEVPSNEIEKFIDDYDIKWDEAKRCKDMTKTKCAKQFDSLNDFLIRDVDFVIEELSKDGYVGYAVAPAFSSVVAYSTIIDSKKIWIKGETFTVNEMLGIDINSDYYNNYSMGIFYLHPSDPHNFYAPISGKVENIYQIAGTYYSNEPSLIRSNVDVYGKNQRSVIILKNDKLEYIAMVLIGSTCMGSIKVDVNKEDNIEMGKKMGSFQFGGSTIILLFNRLVFEFCPTLLSNSQNRISRVVKPGQYIGKYSILVLKDNIVNRKME